MRLSSTPEHLNPKRMSWKTLDNYGTNDRTLGSDIKNKKAKNPPMTMLDTIVSRPNTIAALGASLET
jgi:hypothetical protein